MRLDQVKSSSKSWRKVLMQPLTECYLYRIKTQYAWHLPSLPFHRTSASWGITDLKGTVHLNMQMLAFFTQHYVVLNLCAGICLWKTNEEMFKYVHAFTMNLCVRNRPKFLFTEHLSFCCSSFYILHIQTGMPCFVMTNESPWCWCQMSMTSMMHWRTKNYFFKNKIKNIYLIYQMRFR